VLLGFGAVAIEHWLAARRMRGTALAAIAISSALVAPMAVPVLPVPSYIAYADAMGMSPSALAGEHQKLSALPQHFADMFGWRDMAAAVEAVWRTLSPEDQARAVVFGQNYGEAAAIDVFGHGLPPAISAHNNYYVWGPRGHDGSVMVVIGGNRAKMEKQFRSVTLAGRVEAPLAMPYEAHQPIYILRGARTPLPVLWPRLKHFE
jgi:hypothetical protein